MPRDRREIWSPAKRSIIGEWRNWAKSNPGAAAADDAFGAFYLHLQTNNAHLLTFPSDGPFKAVRAWLARRGPDKALMGGVPDEVDRDPR